MSWRIGTWGLEHSDKENPEDFIKQIKIPILKLRFCWFNDGSLDEIKRNLKGDVIK